jgi:CubicO group peptidase (beta-lactamase class C family)
MTESASAALRGGAEYIRRWLAYRYDFRNLAGLVVAIAQGNDVLMTEGYGFASIERRQTMTPRHVFRIASHSKMFTATAVMQLVEQGRLRLDDSVGAHLPWLTQQLTVRQLLNHTSGTIRDGVDADHWLTQKPFPTRDELRAIAAQGRVLEPNQRFKYSNIGYGLLGLIVEAVSGTTYNDYVREHIVERLGLGDTGPDVDAEVESALGDRLVTGYTADQPRGTRRPLPSVPTHALASATGFYATAADLCRFAAAHFLDDPVLLSDASKREMQQPYWSIDQADENYGLGFSIREIGDRRMLGHAGGFPGQSTRTMWDPRDHLVVVVLSNSAGPDAAAGPIAESIVRILDFAAEQTPSDAAPLLLDRFTGRFSNLWSVYDVAAFGNQLVLLSPAADNPVHSVTRLEVVDVDTLRIIETAGYGSDGELVHYERDADGQTRCVRIGGISTYPAPLPST